MAQSHHQDHSEIAVPQYDDGYIVTMRIGGYLGVLPYRVYPELTPSDQRAFMVGCRYLSERGAQADFAKWQKANPNASHAECAAHINAYLKAWNAPTDGEFTTVAGMRAEIGKAYMLEKFPNLADDSGQKGAENRATIAKNLPAMLTHPRHGVEIARRLAAKFAEYVKPKERDSKGDAGAPVVDETKVATLDLDAVA